VVQSSSEILLGKCFQWPVALWQVASLTQRLWPFSWLQPLRYPPFSLNLLATPESIVKYILQATFSDYCLSRSHYILEISASLVSFCQQALEKMWVLYVLIPFHSMHQKSYQQNSSNFSILLLILLASWAVIFLSSSFFHCTLSNTALKVNWCFQYSAWKSLFTRPAVQRSTFDFPSYYRQQFYHCTTWNTIFFCL
jgi:hypothetical protein